MTEDFITWAKLYEAQPAQQAGPNGVTAPPPVTRQDLRRDMARMSGQSVNAYGEVIRALEELASNPQGIAALNRILTQLEQATGREFTQLRTRLTQGAKGHTMAQPQVPPPVV